MNKLPLARQEMPANLRLRRHRHVHAYAAVVLSGGYLEAGEAGRRLLNPGDVAVHAPFAAHLNSVGMNGARVLNLPVADVADAFGTVADPDAIVRLAQSNLADAAALLQAAFTPAHTQCLDWPDQLALDLSDNAVISFAEWASLQGLAPETLSRGFFRAFGVTPKRWRYEQRARRALHAIVDGAERLASIALDLGYADQAQMTRAVTDISGSPPSAWRKVNSRQDGTG
jgi:AraC-like DNA-binding protein